MWPSSCADKAASASSYSTPRFDAAVKAAGGESSLSEGIPHEEGNAAPMMSRRQLFLQGGRSHQGEDPSRGGDSFWVDGGAKGMFLQGGGRGVEEEIFHDLPRCEDTSMCYP